MTDDKDEDELRTRRARFLDVEKIDDLYNETSVKGEVRTYTPDRSIPELDFERMAFHTMIDGSSGRVRPLITATTCKGFRAIGTEGSYQFLDVRIGSDTEPGVAVIRKTYDRDGNNLNGSMVIGLTDDAVRSLRDGITGTLRLSDLTGLRTFGSDHTSRSGQVGLTGLVLPHWREHVIDDKENVVVEWRFKFTTATLSPEGYIPRLGNFPHTTTQVYLRNDGVGIFFRPDAAHPLAPAIQELTGALAPIAHRLRQILTVVVFILVVMAFSALIQYAAHY